jgi:hypothetical protein
LIQNHQHIKIDGRTLIEKLLVVPPLQQNPVFQDEACFLYFNEGGSEIKTPTEQLKIQETESVLLRCGTYFADLFSNKKTGLCDVCVIHFYPDVLKNIFQDDLNLIHPNSDKTQYAQPLSRKLVMDHFMESLNFYF